MNEVWHQRLTAYHKELLRYAKYIFNDHFIIAVLFYWGESATNTPSYSEHP